MFWTLQLSIGFPGFTKRYGWLNGCCFCFLILGIQTRLFKCRKQEDDSEVTESNCFSSNKPEPLTKPCNLTACERYVCFSCQCLILLFSKLNSREKCIWKLGNITRTFLCSSWSIFNRVRAKYFTNCNGRSLADCLRWLQHVHLLKFISFILRFEWRASKWTSCSLPCNGGNQTRTLECRAVLADHQANSSLCTEDKPETVQICNDEPCPAKWIVGNWTEVSKIMYSLKWA